MRINKLFSNYGICSRKETNKLIEEKRIEINGKPCVLGQWVKDEDEILFDNKPIVPMKKVYIALNKPIGITCTAESKVKDNIISFMKYSQYIFPVGRLDKESQGLILMTNDGEVANKILESDNMHEKEYIVQLDKNFDDEFIRKMSSGVDISIKKNIFRRDNIVRTRPCEVTRINENTFKIILTQGMNKQIRKMSGALGYNVIRLERIRIMNIKLDDIKIGKWRYLYEEEIQNIIKKLEI